MFNLLCTFALSVQAFLSFDINFDDPTIVYSLMDTLIIKKFDFKFIQSLYAKVFS